MKTLLVLIALQPFVFLSPLSARAEQYSLNYLGSFISDDEHLVAASGGSWAVFTDNRVADSCPFLVNLKTRATKDLCKVGIRRAYAVNRRGMVVGTTQRGKFRRTAAAWSAETGLRIIGYHPEGAIESVARDVNDQGVVVGYVTRTRTVLDPEYGDYQEKFLSAFRWSAAKGTQVLSVPNADSAYAAAINNRGTIALFGMSNSSDQPGFVRLYLKTGNRRAKRIDQQQKTKDFLRYYYEDPEYALVSLNERGQLLLTNKNFLYSPWKGWEEIASLGYCSRCDYETFGSISPTGRVVSQIYTTQPTLNEKSKAPTFVRCLVPQNRIIGGSSSYPGHFNKMTSGFFQDDEILLFGGDVSGDGKGEQLFSLQPKKTQDAERDYCLSIEAQNISFTPGHYVGTLGPKSAVYSWRYWVRGADGSLRNDIDLQIVAEQSVDWNLNVSCAPIKVTDLNKSGGSGSFDLEPDPAFHYTLAFKTGKYQSPPLPDTNVYDSGYILHYGDFQAAHSRVGPCRQPFEGLAW